MSKLKASSSEYAPKYVTTTVSGVPESITSMEKVRKTPAGQLVAPNPMLDVRNFEKGTTAVGKGRRRKTSKKGGKKRKTHRRRV